MPEDRLGMLNINSRAVPTTAVYVNKSLQSALAETLRLAFLSPLHRQGYCSRTGISRASHKQPTRPWKELYYKRLCTEDCWCHVLGSAPCQEEARLWNLKACPTPPHWLPTIYCGVSSGFKNSKFGLMEVKPQKELGHVAVTAYSVVEVTQIYCIPFLWLNHKKLFSFKIAL